WKRRAVATITPAGVDYSGSGRSVTDALPACHQGTSQKANRPVTWKPSGGATGGAAFADVGLPEPWCVTPSAVSQAKQATANDSERMSARDIVSRLPRG